MAAEEPSLPERYGLDRLVLMARDPHWLYAFWEVTPRTAADALQRPGISLGEGEALHLRLYHVGRDPRPVAEHAVDPVGARYLRAPLPGETYQAEIGIAWHDRFRPLVRSRPVSVPPAGPARMPGARGRAEPATEWVRNAETLYALARPSLHPASSSLLTRPQGGEPARANGGQPSAADASRPGLGKGRRQNEG